MKILVALPDHQYFLWQMIVQINNFRKFGYERDVIYLIGKNNLQSSTTLKNIIRNGGVKCNFYVFNDDRKSKEYTSSLRPHLIKKYFELFPDKQKETYFYIDPDMIFTKKFNLYEYLNDDIWYVSNTTSYLNSYYIKSKGENLFKEMCKIVGISQKKVIANDANAGGAQYLLKNTSIEFWEKVERDSEELYKHMVKTKDKYTPEYPIQAWTSDMWAVLWNAWLAGNETKIIPEFNFSWATDEIERWDKNNIYHNAGAVVDDGTYFLKSRHQLSPFNKELICSDKYCSYNYVKEIKDTERNFKQIIY